MDKIQVQEGTLSLNLFLAHLTQALLITVNRLRIFGNDRPLFWRESASGISVIGLYIAKITWDTLSIVIESLLYVTCWYITVKATGSLLIYLPSFMLVAFVGAGCGYAISTLVPPKNAVMAAAAAIMIPGASIG